MQTSPRPYDYSRADVLVAQDKARSTRFGPPEYTFLPLQPLGLRPSALWNVLPYSPLCTAATLIAISRPCEQQEPCKLLQ
jgi:hypothetical protein